MFYSQSLLLRNGPLGNIWIAAHCFKKLKRNQIDHTDIPSSVDKIMPELQISYRILGHLLLGIVRIFSKKVEYLYCDCSEALACVRNSFTNAHDTVTRGTVSKSRCRSVDAKAHRPHKPISLSQKSAFVKSVETMRASYHHVTISIPERLELDLFDLGVPDDEDAVNVKPDEQSSPQDHRLDDPCDPYFQNECTQPIIHDEINSSCFTPVSDVLPSHMMNIDLEFPEEYNLKSVETNEKENLQGDIVVHELLEVQQSLTPSILNEELDDQLHPLEVVKMKDSENAKNLRKLVEPLGSPEKLLSNYENLPACVSEDVTVMNPIKPLKVDPLPGVPSPKLIIRTPAKRVDHPARKKSKILFDGMVVLSNEALRKGIHDPSNLVLKRKKAPHTLLDAWKSKKICNLQQHLLEPLIPCMGSKLKGLFESSSHFHSILNVPADRHKSVDKENHINKSTELEHSYHKLATDISSPDNRTELPTAAGFSEVEMKKSFVESSDTSLDLVDQLESQEIFAARQESGWSSRTRVVGRHLYSKLLDPQSEERNLSLAQLLKKRKRADAAKFFYEILVLKSCGSIDVNQDSPYGMILITPTEKLEAEFRS